MITTLRRPQLTLLPAGSLRGAWAAPRYRLRVEGAAIEGLNEPFEALLEQPLLVVGRDRRAGLLLPDTRISRRHAYLHLTPHGVYLVHLCRKRGIADDGVSPRGGWLAAPAAVDFGPYRITLTRVPGEGDADVASRVDLMGMRDDPSAALDLHFRSPEGTRAMRRVKRPLTLIGRGKPSHLQLVHPSISQPHCILVHDRAGLWVIDLLSRAGTHVNGRSTPLARIEPSDRLQLGEVTVEARFAQDRTCHGAVAHQATAAAADVLNAADQVPLVERPFEQPAAASASAAFAVSAHESKQLVREDPEHVLSRLQRSEPRQRVAADQLQQEAAQAEQLAERVEQFSSLCLESRETIRMLAERVDGMQGELGELEHVWQAQRERLERRLDEWEHSRAVAADTAESARVEQQIRESELRETCTALQREWQRRRRERDQESTALVDQCRGLEERLLALQQSGARVQQSVAELDRQSETARDAWRQQTGALAHDQADLRRVCDAIRREQQRLAEFSAQLRREFDALEQQRQEQQRAMLDEQARTREQLQDARDQWEVFQAKQLQAQRQWKHERQSLALRAAERDERQQRFAVAVDAQGKQLEQLRRDVAALDRGAHANNGNGGDLVHAAVRAGQPCAELPEARARSTNASQPKRQRAVQHAALDDSQPPSGSLPASGQAMGLGGDRMLERRMADASEQADQALPDGAVDPEDACAQTDDVSGLDETATQWLFHRAAILRERRRRTWRCKIVLALAAVLLLAGSIAAFALWHTGLVQEVQRVFD